VKSELLYSLNGISFKPEFFGEEAGQEELLDVVLLEVTSFLHKHMLRDFDVDALCFLDAALVLLEQGTLFCDLLQRVEKQLVHVLLLVLILFKLA